ncbi:phospholipase [Geobacter anodireducens]|nr:phospholipase [Geobacter anodireducens]
MKKILVVLMLVLLSASAPAEPVLAAGTVEVCFTPGEDCAGKIVREIDAARSQILVQAYSFTSKPIAKALLDAHKRGVKVEAVLDKSQRKERYTSATFLNNAGILVFIDDRHAIAHNKIMIIDRRTVFTGSFNFTKAAQERNAENLLIIKRDKALVEKYLANYAVHREHSEPYAVR